MLHNKIPSQTYSTSVHQRPIHPETKRHEPKDIDSQSQQERRSTSDYDLECANEIDVDDLPDTDSLFDFSSKHQTLQSPKDDDFDLSDPEMVDLLETVDLTSGAINTSTKEGPSTEPDGPTSKRGLHTLEDDREDYFGPMRRKKPRLSIDFLDDDDGDFASSETLGFEPEEPIAPTPALDRPPKGTGLFLSSSSPIKSNIPAAGKQVSTNRPGLQRDIMTKTLDEGQAAKKSTDIEALRDITNITSSQGRNEGKNLDDERLRKQREEDTKWEGFDPEFVAQFRDLVELI